MKLDHIKLDHLKPSPQNMRAHVKKPDVSDILPSIRTRGILVPLIVRPNGTADTFEIVAGLRRFTAATLISEEAGEFDPLPCVIMEESDDAAALEASILENCARLDPDPMTQYEAFAGLSSQGRSVTDIADMFGITELIVTRRLALGNLIPPIRKAYRDEQIDNQTIQHLTLASVKQQRAWMKLVKDKDSYAPTGRQLKGWLFGGQEIDTSVAIFDFANYKGHIVSDLFGDSAYFADSDQFWALQNKAIAAMKADYEKQGWQTVHILDVGQQFYSWNYREVSKDDGGAVNIQVCHDGSVKAHEGYLSEKEYRALEKARKAANGEPVVTATRPEVSKVMQNYLILHRHAVVQDALAKAPQLALRLTLAHMIVGTCKWSVTLDAPSPKKEAIGKSLDASKAVQAMSEKRKTVLDILKLSKHQHHVISRSADSEKTASLFAHLITLSDEAVLKILAFVMAESLAADTPIVEALGNKLKVDMRDYWQADDTFFAILREKPTVNAILKEVGGKTVADGNISATAKVQKDIIQDFLEGRQGRTQVKGWVPKFMAFPARHYTQNGGIGHIHDWEAVKSHFAKKRTVSRKPKLVKKPTSKKGAAAAKQAA